MDEDELNEELAELQQEELSNKMIGGTVPVGDRVDREQVSRLPGVGTGELRKGRAQQVEEDDEEEELRKLQAEMAM
jgi:charged multivesicular body protein 4